MKNLLKRLSVALVTTALGIGTSAFAEDGKIDVPKEKLHVYLLIGQSNMAGRAPFTEKEAAAIPRCFLLNGEDTWEAATNPLNRYSTIRKGLGMQKMNPGYSFSKKMLEVNPDISLGLVVNAKGGTKIEQWEKGTKFYKEAIRRAKAAQETGTLKGILWHQGESNNGNPDGYLEKLTKLVEDLRDDLGAPNLPFVAGQIKGEGSINQQIAQLPEKLEATGFASSEDLNTYDRWHFDAESAKLLGERYAEQMTKLGESAVTRED
ncbi:MAG: sialate O-acetylesterase [Akkermansiaceae bacterium]